MHISTWHWDMMTCGLFSRQFFCVLSSVERAEFIGIPPKNLSKVKHIAPACCQQALKPTLLHSFSLKKTWRGIVFRAKPRKKRESPPLRWFPISDTPVMCTRPSPSAEVSPTEPKISLNVDPLGELHLDSMGDWVMPQRTREQNRNHWRAKDMRGGCGVRQ